MGSARTPDTGPCRHGGRAAARQPAQCGAAPAAAGLPRDGYVSAGTETNSRGSARGSRDVSASCPSDVTQEVSAWWQAGARRWFLPAQATPGEGVNWPTKQGKGRSQCLAWPRARTRAELCGTGGERRVRTPRSSCATLTMQPSKPDRPLPPLALLWEQPSKVRQDRAFALFGWGFPRREACRAGVGLEQSRTLPAAGEMWICVVSGARGAPLPQHCTQDAMAGGLGHCHPQPQSWSCRCATVGEPSPAPACLSTFTQPCAEVMHLLQNSFWSGDSRDTIFSMWDLRSVCQTVSVKTRQS